MLCPTRWTARSAVINAVLKGYTVLIEAMEEINLTTRDEYGLKAGGLLISLQTFRILFGLSLSYVPFTRAEEVSRVLQAKDTCLQNALKVICLLRVFKIKARGMKVHLSNFTAVLSKQLNNF